MAVKLKIHDKQLKKKLRNATSSGLQRATVFLHSKCREATNKPNSGVRRNGRTVYPSPSSPGEPPRKRTGWGQRHIVWEFDKKRIAGRVGIMKAGIYMIYLELGTRHIAKRPWLVETLNKHKRMIGLLATTGGKRGGL